MSQLEHQGSDAPSTFVQEQHESLAALLLRPDQSGECLLAESMSQDKKPV